MNSILSDSSLWSEAVFGGIELGDKRVTKRLVQIGNQLSNWSGSSLWESSLGDEGLVEGGIVSYVLIKLKPSNCLRGL